MKAYYLFLLFFFGIYSAFGQASDFDRDVNHWEDPKTSVEELKTELDRVRKEGSDENRILLLESIYTIRHDKDPIKRVELLITLSEKNAEAQNAYSAYANYNISCMLSSYKISSFGLDYADKAISDSKKIHNERTLYLSYKNKAGIYFQMKDFVRASENFKLASKTKGQGDVNEVASDRNNVGLCYLELKDYAKAIEYFSKGIQLLKNDPKGKEEILQLVKGNLGTAYVKSGEIEKGTELLEQERAYYETNQMFTDNYVSTLMQLVNIEAAKNDKEKLIKYAKELFNCLDQVEVNTNRLRAIEMLIALSEKQSIGISSTEINVLHNRILIDHLTQQSKLHDGLTNFLYEEKIKTLVTQSKNEEKNSASGLPGYLVAILCMFFVAIILGGLVLFKRRIKRKTIELKEKEKSKETVLARQQLLEREMENQQQQLNMLITNLKIKQQTESGFLEKIKELKRNKNATTEQVIKELQLGLTNLFDIDKKLITEGSGDIELDLDISVKMKEKHPDLTQTEVQMCSYFINELSAKEIGLLLNISDISVRVAKNKIKKKIGLTKDQNLNEYLQSLLR